MFEANDNSDCPTRYGSCTCNCHVWSSMKHFAPCCYAPDSILGQMAALEEESPWGLNV